MTYKIKIKINKIQIYIFVEIKREQIDIKYQNTDIKQPKSYLKTKKNMNYILVDSVIQVLISFKSNSYTFSRFDFLYIIRYTK